MVVVDLSSVEGALSGSAEKPQEPELVEPLNCNNWADKLCPCIGEQEQRDNLPASMDIEANIPKGVPPGRPFYWDVEATGDTLTALDMGHLVTAFREAKVDGRDLLSMCMKNTTTGISERKRALGLGMKADELKKMTNLLKS